MIQLANYSILQGADKKKDDDDDDERFQDPENEVGLFAGGAYDEDDDEADLIYQAVDEKMEKRRKTQRESREKAEREEYEQKNPKIQQQFADLKRALTTVTDDEWANLPEVGDLTGRNRRAREAMRQKFYPTPDSVIAGAAAGTQFETSVQDGGESVDQADGTMTNFVSIGKAKTKALESRLDRSANVGGGAGGDSAVGATNIDPKGYLTSLSRSTTQTAAEIGDIKRVRELLDSVIKTNPKHGPGWIAAARLEELAGKSVQARNVIGRGCEYCPKNEDVWLESMRLNDTHNAKIIVAKAVRENPKSVRLWVEAMKLEVDPRAKRRVVRKALDIIPQSVTLWKEAVNLEEDESDARILLARAVELIPLSVELWLALARLESAKNAQAVLNKARAAIPTSHEIWLAAARLQEQTGEASRIGAIMRRAVKELAKVDAMPTREDWIKEAEKCEEEGAKETCHAIIRETLGWGLEEDDDRKKVWMDDADASMSRERYETARAIYAYALRVFYTKKSIWRSAAELERNHGTKEALWSLLEKAVEACPQAEVLWMMLAKEKWQAGDVHGARVVLAKAFSQNPNNEDIWLAAVKLEAENDEHERARTLLETARREAGTDRVWIKSVAFERQQGNLEAALTLVNEGLQLYPKADKLWMMKGQIYEAENQLPPAREAYNAGTRACPKSVPLWLLFARLEEKAGVLIRARSVLDRGRLAVAKCAELWCESIRIERRAGNTAQAKQLMAKALQECPHSGLLWAENIWHLEARTQRRPRLVEAVEKVGNDPVLYVAVARNFAAERKLPKALNWFEKAILVDPDYGDTWAWYWVFLKQHGSEEKRQDVLAKLQVSEPRHGEIWQRVAKDPAARFRNAEEILMAVVKEIEAM